MKLRSCMAVLSGVVLCAVSSSSAQTFQLVVAETPPVQGGGQPVERYAIAGEGGLATRLDDIPGSMMDDPASIAFRTPTQLFVGNRAAHTGAGYISTFEFSHGFADFTEGPMVTGNGLSDVHQIAFNPVDGELFATNWTTGIMSRFTFDGDGRAVPNGMLNMPDGQNQLGVALRAADEQLFVSSYTFVRRFLRQPDGSYTSTAALTIPGATLIHYLKFRGDELYVCDISTDRIYRFTFDVDGTPMSHGWVDSPSPVDVAFSPDGQEMYAANHLEGNISRYLYESGTDAWNFSETMVTPRLGGIATAPGSACPPDLNGDGVLDFFDVQAFLGFFAAENPMADLNGDGLYDFFDVQAYLNQFAAGCP